MKSKLFSFLIAGMLGLSFLGVISASNPSIVINLTPHSPIRIDNNGELLAEASSGDGSLGNPYIIENLLINTTGGTGHDGIYVGNVTDHFIVRNCVLNDTGASHLSFVDYGIRYVDCKADTTTNMTITGNYSIGIDIACVNDYINITDSIVRLSESFSTIGIQIDSDNNRFLNFTIIHDNVIISETSGIIIKYQHLSTVLNNTLFSNGTNYCGLELYNTDNSTINNNYVYTSGNDSQGIIVDTNWVSWGDNNVVVENAIISQSYSNTCGIYCYQARTLVLDSNFIDGFELGIWLDEYTDWSDTIENTVINCTNGLFVGGYYDRTDEITSYGDSFYNCSGTALQIIDCPNTSINNVTINNTFIGILCTNIEESTSDIDIYGGNISNCTNHGVDISGNVNIIIDGVDILYSGTGISYFDVEPSNHGLITDNIISYCTWEPIWVEHIYDIEISFNDISNNGYGIYLVDSTNCHVEHNTIYTTTYSGIQFEFIDNSTINHNNVLYCESGIQFIDSVYNIISHNNLSENTLYGIVLDSNCNYNQIFENMVVNNSYCGISMETSSENNTIYSNWMIDNAIQAYDSNLYNKWNLSYVMGGGNYYSDYTSYDNYSGAGQNIPGADGIGDDTYAISGGSAIDYYPLNLYPLTVPIIPPFGNNESNVSQLGDIIFDMIPVIFIILFIVLIVTQVNKIYKRK